jgi:molybdate transport system substrate-binding protein
MRVLIICLMICLFPGAQASAEQRLVVFAAASMKEPLEAVAKSWEELTGRKVALSLAASSVLARQVAAGAPADIFISADQEWMDWLKARGSIVEDSRRLIARNRLVLVARQITDEAGDLGALLTAGRFAMGDPSHVPAGRYAEAALRSAGLWEIVQPHAVFGENVRVALDLVRRGEANAAIVYHSDRAASPDLTIVHEFLPDSHPPITYWAAATRPGQDVEDFLEFLEGPEGQAILVAHGFLPAAAQP